MRSSCSAPGTWSSSPSTTTSPTTSASGRGTDVVDFIAEQQETHERDLWPRDGISLHTANPSGREAMARTIRRYAEKGGLRVHESRAGGQPKFTFRR